MLLEGGLGGRTDATSTSLELSPALFAGEIGYSPESKNRLAYSFLTRNKNRYDLMSQSSLSGDDLFDEPSVNYISDDLRVNQNVSEYWFGFTWARKLAENLDPLHRA